MLPKSKACLLLSFRSTRHTLQTLFYKLPIYSLRVAKLIYIRKVVGKVGVPPERNVSRDVVDLLILLRRFRVFAPNNLTSSDLTKHYLRSSAFRIWKNDRAEWTNCAAAFAPASAAKRITRIGIAKVAGVEEEEGAAIRNCIAGAAPEEINGRWTRSPSDRERVAFKSK